jgi:hypothetical protein
VRRLAAIALLLAACAHEKSGDAFTRLKDSVDGYNHAFRWKYYERAATFLPKDIRASFLATYEDDDSSLQVEDYSIIDLDVGDDSKSATAKVKVRYMMLPSVTVEHVTLVQHWHELEGQWILETEEHSIRPLDPSKTSSDPRVSKVNEADPSKEGKTEIKIKKPGDPDEGWTQEPEPPPAPKP